MRPDGAHGRGTIVLIEAPQVSGQERAAFTLVELLVVIGIVALLIAILVPTLAAAQSSARRIQCQSNLRQLGAAMVIYAQENDGWLVPCYDEPTQPGGVASLGIFFEPGLRWPAKLFRISGPTPKTDDPAAYTTRLLVCPADLDPMMARTYALNGQLLAYHVKLGSHNLAGQSASDVVTAAEKLTDAYDYSIEPNQGDFETCTDLYRHGAMHGSNYLFLDGHAALLPGEKAKGAMDPWTARGIKPATQPQ
jgi:prepilin-type N-terminal cleavage/methylation domain-containing protein/prepilin-type processing-associated H-X9-DG protein